MSIWLRIYYTVRPIVPRFIQVAFRRRLVKRIQKSTKAYWPINTIQHKESNNLHTWPQERKFSLVLVHDVEKLHGYQKCDDMIEIDKRFGFRSCVNFVPYRYPVDIGYIRKLQSDGFEVGVHGLKHDGKLFLSDKIFQSRAETINEFLHDWGSVGFYSPSMLYDKEMIHRLDILYDQSTFDTDPFEPEPHVTGDLLPSVVRSKKTSSVYVELPYTLSQDHTLFIIMQERNISLWKRKLDWIAERGGMALIKTHPDYMDFSRSGRFTSRHYPSDLYESFLEYIYRTYRGQYWHVLPKEMAEYWKSFET
jgi:hypothetical protein